MSGMVDIGKYREFLVIVRGDGGRGAASGAPPRARPASAVLSAGQRRSATATSATRAHSDQPT